MMNVGNTAYLWDKLGWTPRPGLDLDAGVRLQRGLPISHWPVIFAWHNQYGSPNNYLRTFCGDFTDSVFGVVRGESPVIAPFGLGALTPSDLDTIFAPSVPAWMPKVQTGV